MPWALSKNLCLEAVGARTLESAIVGLLSMLELRELASLGGQGRRWGLVLKLTLGSAFCHHTAARYKQLTYAASWG